MSDNTRKINDPTKRSYLTADDRFRLTALRHATDEGSGMTASTIVGRAEKYYEFLTGGSKDAETTPTS